MFCLFFPSCFVFFCECFICRFLFDEFVLIKKVRYARSRVFFCTFSIKFNVLQASRLWRDQSAIQLRKLGFLVVWDYLWGFSFCIYITRMSMEMRILSIAWSFVLIGFFPVDPGWIVIIFRLFYVWWIRERLW